MEEPVRRGDVARMPARKPSKSRARKGLAVTFLALYVGVVLAVTMWPTPVDAGHRGLVARLLELLHRGGMPEWFGYLELEFFANVLMFVPFGFLIGLVLPRKTIWVALVLVPTFSSMIEWIQAGFLEARVASVHDVVANTVGGWMGVLAAFLIRAMVHAHDEKAIARTTWEAERNSREG